MVTATPTSWRLRAALPGHLKPFSQAGIKLGGMALPTIPLSNSNLVGASAARRATVERADDTGGWRCRAQASPHAAWPSPPTWQGLNVADDAAILALTTALLLVQVVKLCVPRDGLPVVHARPPHLAVHLLGG